MRALHGARHCSLSLILPFFLKEKAPSNPSNPSKTQQPSAFVEKLLTVHRCPTSERPSSHATSTGIDRDERRARARYGPWQGSSVGVACQRGPPANARTEPVRCPIFGAD
jgi:hypothetical protein